MNVWHLTGDSPRIPHRVAPGETVKLMIGTWPIEPGQAVWIVYHVEGADAEPLQCKAEASWHRNRGPNSEWVAEIGPFPIGSEITYQVRGRSGGEEYVGPETRFRVSPRLHLAILWHQHQPLYKDLGHPGPRGSYRMPWVRLHALRDYYSMAALFAQHPDLHLTINLTPVLLWQIEDYVSGDARDQALEVTLKAAEQLTATERDFVISRFFDAHWHNQIFPHPRYKELFAKARDQQPFSAQDLRDLQMWFNLAWFGNEFHVSDVALVTGETVRIRRFCEQGRDFALDDVDAMVLEQYKILRAVVPIHSMLQDRGQVEVSTTPFYHPILPLLIDSDGATIDRPGGQYPPRFQRQEDARAQVDHAIAAYRRLFDRPPRGMWPAEGAVAQSVVPIFAGAGLQWTATDQGVLARSGRWGYRTDDPDVLCQPYRADVDGESLSVFFRDTTLADAIGFRYHGYEDSTLAAREFLDDIRARFADRFDGDGDRVLTIVLDGENAWGAYRKDARPFLHALYGLLEEATDVQTVTPGGYLAGEPRRYIRPHPVSEQTVVHDLFTGSWIDENGSAPGVDLGTWIGEPEENRAWHLLGEAREALERAGLTPEKAPAAFQALHAAEGSDWYWWFGEDQDSGNEAEFDELFRGHLRSVYRDAGLAPPDSLERPISTRTAIWSFTDPIAQITRGDALTIRAHCPGELVWWLNEETTRQKEPLVPAGGAMAGVSQYNLTLGPFPRSVTTVAFLFRCTDPGCSGDDVCCDPAPHSVQIDE